MHSDKPGILMREQLLRLLRAYGEEEILPKLPMPQVYQIEIRERQAN